MYSYNNNFERNNKSTASLEKLQKRYPCNAAQKTRLLMCGTVHIYFTSINHTSPGLQYYVDLSLNISKLQMVDVLKLHEDQGP